jgi:hypothetical protein
MADQVETAVEDGIAKVQCQCESIQATSRLG